MVPDTIITETDRLILRHFQATDADALDRVFGDSQVMDCDGTKSPQWVRGWMTSHIEQHYRNWGFGMWAVVKKSSRSVIGYCGLSRYAGRCADHEAEIGYRLIRPSWGQGFATEAARATTVYAWEILRRQRIIAMIDPGNRASIRVAEKIGFRYEKEV